MSATVPSQLTTMASRRLARTRRNPSSAGIVGVERHPGGHRAAGQVDAGRAGGDLGEVAVRDSRRPSPLDHAASSAAGFGYPASSTTSTNGSPMPSARRRVARRTAPPSAVVFRAPFAPSRNVRCADKATQRDQHPDVEQLGEPEPQRPGRDVVGDAWHAATARAPAPRRRRAARAHRQPVAVCATASSVRGGVRRPRAGRRTCRAPCG